MGNRNQQILQLLYQDGYVRTSIVHEHLSTLSIQTIRRNLKELCGQGLIDYKELPSGKGPGERIYFLLPEGLKVLAKKSHELTAYKKKLRKIHVTKLRHYLQTRKVEKVLLHHIHHSGLFGDSCNEFSDDGGALNIKFKSKNKWISIRSDAMLSIKKANFPRAVLLLEMDMGTENMSVIRGKIHNYYRYFQSDLPTKRVKVFPIYTVFVGEEDRLLKMLKVAQRCQGKEFFLWLALNKLSVDLYRETAFLNWQGESISLHSIIERREPLLLLQESLYIAARQYPLYRIVVNTIFTHPKDPFFPLLVNIQGHNSLFRPDGYIRIYKNKEHGRTIEQLFALIVVFRHHESPESFCRKVLYCEAFLTRHNYRKKVTSLPKSYGLFVVVDDAEQIQKVQGLLKNSQISDRLCFIEIRNLVAEKIIKEPVWYSAHAGSFVSFIPK